MRVNYLFTSIKIKPNQRSILWDLKRLTVSAPLSFNPTVNVGQSSQVERQIGDDCLLRQQVGKGELITGRHANTQYIGSIAPIFLFPL